MTSNLFIVVLKYIVPIEDIDAKREEHLKYLDVWYSRGTFIVSGMQVPRSGGIIMAKCASKQELEKILQDDPFSINSLAEYTIYEFHPTRYTTEFKAIMDKQ